VPQLQTPDVRNHTAVAPVALSQAGSRVQQATYHHPHVHQRTAGDIGETSAAATGTGATDAPEMVHHRNLQHHQ